MDSLINPSNVAFHGPDTVEHLESFSVDSIVGEFKECCPDILEIFHSLGKSSDDDPNREAKIVTSLCILMKSYSRKVLGIQLMTTFMLLSRATSRQVGTTLINHDHNLE